MSVLARVYRRSLSINWEKAWRGLKMAFFFAVPLYLSLGLFNVYAQEEGSESFEETQYESQGVYNETNELINIHTGDDTPHTGNTNAGTAVAVLDLLVVSTDPQLSSNYDEIQASNKLSPLTKAGFLGAVNNGIIAMYNNYPTVNVGSHLAEQWVPGYEGSTAIYAADDGYALLDELEIDILWERVRTIAYIFFVFVLILAGFMIMFRQKIGGQVAITIFNTLPNVVMALIFVTFSFAFVGLMINVGAILINVVAGLLDPTGVHITVINDPFSLIGGFVRDHTGALGQIVLIPSILIGGLVGVITAFTGGGALIAGFIAGGITFLIMCLIVLGIVVFASVKVYITLLKAFLGLIIDTVMAPIFLTVGAIPGQTASRDNWFKRILKNIGVFVMVFFLINVGTYILSTSPNLGFPSGLTGGDIAATPTDGTPVGAILKAGLVLALFFMAAESPKFLDDIFPVAVGKGSAEAMGGVAKSFGKIPIIGSFFG